MRLHFFTRLMRSDSSISLISFLQGAPGFEFCIIYYSAYFNYFVIAIFNVFI